MIVVLRNEASKAAAALLFALFNDPLLGFLIILAFFGGDACTTGLNKVHNVLDSKRFHCGIQNLNFFVKLFQIVLKYNIVQYCKIKSTFFPREIDLYCT